MILSDQKLQMSAGGGDGTSQGTFGEPNPDERFSFNIPDHFLGNQMPLGDLSASKYQQQQQQSYQEYDKENQMALLDSLTQNLEEMKIIKNLIS